MNGFVLGASMGEMYKNLFTLFTYTEYISDKNARLASQSHVYFAGDMADKSFALVFFFLSCHCDVKSLFA